MTDSKKLHSVHFLRFVAAVAVVFHHTISVFGTHFALGAAGVDIFFVISGLVIGLSLLSGDSPRDFAAKRLIRVLPAYWLATIAFMWFEYFSNGGVFAWTEILRSFALWPVFGTGWHPIYFAGWSLTYELLFYMVAVTSLACFRRSAWFACLLVMGVFAATRFPVPFGAPNSHFASQMCLEFCFGLAVAYAVRQKVALSKHYGLSLILFSVFVFACNPTDASDPRQIFWGVPAAALILGLLSFDDAKFFRHPFAKLGGDASYAVYLTHLTVLNALYYIAFRMGINRTEHPWVVPVFALPSAIAIGILAHLAIEKPVLKSLRWAFIRRSAQAPLSEPVVVDRVSGA